MIAYLASLAVGIALLVFAADHFVLGASRVASLLNLPSVVIGAVVIGFGTSLPELVVSILAAGGGDRALGTGNIIGSNVANLGLVLGVAALITTMTISSTTLRREIPMSIGATLLMAVLYVDGTVELWDGVVLATGLSLAVGFLVRSGMNDDIERDVSGDSRTTSDIVRTLAGLVGTVVGAQLIVWGATGVAEVAGVSGGFVGFSLVALGTSLPELVTTFVCARRGETGLIIGNLFGSNLFNSLAVGGGIGLVGAGPILDDRLTTWGIASMLVVSLGALVLAWRGRFVGRVDGVLLIAAYIVSMVVLGVGSADPETPQSDPPSAHQSLPREGRAS